MTPVIQDEIIKYENQLVKKEQQIKIAEEQAKAAGEDLENGPLSELWEGKVVKNTKSSEVIRLIREANVIRRKLDALRNSNSNEEEKIPWSLTYPRDLGKVNYKKNYMNITFWEHQVDTRTNDKLEKQIFPSIRLPISPRMFYQNLTIDYERASLDQLQNVIYENAREYGVTRDGISQALGHSVDETKARSMLEGFAYSQWLRTDLDAVKASYFGTGLAYNPNSTARFQMNRAIYREFQPSWTFVPKNSEDARVLSDITKAFKKNGLPKILNAAVDKKIRYANHFKYPRRVKIELFVNDRLLKKTQFLPMVIKTIDISNNDKVYGSGFTDSVPLTKENDELFLSETTITLMLQETSVFTSSSVEMTTQV